MMDNDRMPNDKLRGHFMKVYIDLHFDAVRTWFEKGYTNESVPEAEIIHLLNAMRVGGKYLSYKESTDPDFGNKYDKKKINNMPGI
jgi:hypothetical protein